MVKPMTVAVKVDAKGRLTIPQRMRGDLDIRPGDTLFVECDEERKVLHYAKVENPFDVLVEHAIEERSAGKTRRLRDFAAEHNIALDVG